MAWLLIPPAAVILLIVAVLAIPVQLDVHAELTDRPHARVRLRWLFGLLNVRLGGRRSRVQAPPAEAVAIKNGLAGPNARKPSGRGRRLIAALETRGVMARVVLFVHDLFGLVRVQNFVLRARYGFDDPADTGQLYGALAPVLVLASVKEVDLICTPDFAQQSVEGTCSGIISVRPLSVAGVIVAFLCSPPVWRAAISWRRAS